MSDEPGALGEQPLAQRLRGVIASKDEQIAALSSALETALDRMHRMELRVAELERRLSMDSSDSGTPSSKEGIGAKAGRRAREEMARQESERERSKDRKRGGQPGHQGKGLERDPDPAERKTAEPPAECRSCHASLGGAEPSELRWAQVIDIEILRKVTEVLLPGLACGGCGTVTHAAPPPGFHAGSVAYGPVLNAAAVLLSCYGNVPAERSAQLIGMLTGEDVSAGWVDKAVARMSARLQAGGFDEAMAAALAAEDVLARHRAQLQQRLGHRVPADPHRHPRTSPRPVLAPRPRHQPRRRHLRPLRLHRHRHVDLPHPAALGRPAHQQALLQPRPRPHQHHPRPVSQTHLRRVTCPAYGSARIPLSRRPPLPSRYPRRGPVPSASVFAWLLVTLAITEGRLAKLKRRDW